MEAKLLVNGKEFPIEITDPELQKIVEYGKRTGYERVCKNDMYFAASSDGSLEETYDVGIAFDKKRFESANYYASKEVAENNIRADTLMRQLRRFAVRHRVEKPIWNSEKLNWSIFFDHDGNEIVALSSFWHQSMNVYFDSKETCEAAIDTFRDELLWYFAEYKDSL